MPEDFEVHYTAGVFPGIYYHLSQEGWTVLLPNRDEVSGHAHVARLREIWDAMPETQIAQMSIVAPDCSATFPADMMGTAGDVVQLANIRLRAHQREVVVNYISGCDLGKVSKWLELVVAVSMEMGHVSEHSVHHIPGRTPRR
jgi:hypothetical protein